MEIARQLMYPSKFPGKESYWKGDYGSATVTYDSTKQYELIAAYCNLSSHLCESALFTVKNGAITKISQTTNWDVSNEYYITATKMNSTQIYVSSTGGSSASRISVCLIEKG